MLHTRYEAAVPFYNKLRKIYRLVISFMIINTVAHKGWGLLSFPFLLKYFVAFTLMQTAPGFTCRQTERQTFTPTSFLVWSTEFCFYKRSEISEKANCVPLVQTKHWQSESTLYEITFKKMKKKKKKFVPTTEKFLLLLLPCFQSVLALQAGW